MKEYSWYDAVPAVLTPVKNQGKKCASSYAFSIIAGLEATQALEKGVKA